MAHVFIHECSALEDKKKRRYERRKKSVEIKRLRAAINARGKISLNARIKGEQKKLTNKKTLKTSNDDKKKLETKRTKNTGLRRCKRLKSENVETIQINKICYDMH